MDEFIKLLDPALNYVKHFTNDKKCIVTVESNRKEVTCPYCGTLSSKIHSVYMKEFQDLPIQDKQVIILIENRKMFCLNPGCNHKTFSERFDFISTKLEKQSVLLKRS